MDDLQTIREAIERDWREFDTRCQLTPAVSDAIVSHPIMRELVPAEYGGTDGSVLRWFRWGRDIAAMDASAGWIAAQGAVQNTMMAAQLDADFARVFFSDPRANTAGAVRSTVKAQMVDGRHVKLDGDWEFQSGCTIATYIGGFVTPIGDGFPELPGVPGVMVRAADVEIVRNWNPIGLRGTGSNTVRVDNVTVPVNQLMPFFAGPRAPLQHRLSPIGGSSIGIILAVAAVQLGVSRHALDLATEMLRTKPQGPEPASPPIIKEPTTISAFTVAEGQWRLANAGIEGLVAALDSALRTGDNGAIRAAKVDARLAANVATHMAAEITKTAYDLVGTDAQAADSRLARCFRDAHVLTSHVAGRRRGYGASGRLLLGIEENLDLFGF